MIILITASLSSTLYSSASHWEKFAFVATWSRFHIDEYPGYLPSSIWGLMGLLQFPATPWLCLCLHNSFGLLVSCYQMTVILRSPHLTSQEQEDRPFTNPASSDIYLWLCETVRHWCSLLARPTDWNKCSTSEILKIAPEVDFESSRSPAKSESWNRPNLQCWAVLPTWQHWSMVICVMNVGNQANEASVTCSCPSGDCSCKFVYCPEDVWSTNSCQVQAI